MGQFSGLVKAGLQLGLESLLVRPSRNIGPFEAQVTIEEQHVDDLEISDHPVETGAIISDHAFMRPCEVTIKVAWSDSPSLGAGGGLGGLSQGAIGAVTQTIAGAASVLSGNDVSQSRDVYLKLLNLQRDRIPFDILTGKRAYDNMLIKSLRVTTDRDSENALVATVVCRQVLIVKTSVVAVGAPKEKQTEGATTYPVQDRGVKAVELAPLYNTSSGQASIAPI